MNLTKEQLKYLSDKKNDKYGGYGSFMGMVWNKSIETGSPFEDLLANAIEISIELENMIVEFNKPKKVY